MALESQDNDIKKLLASCTVASMSTASVSSMNTRDVASSSGHDRSVLMSVRAQLTTLMDVVRSSADR